MENEPRVVDEESSKHVMVNELRQINLQLKEINGRILVAIVVVVAILVMLAMP